MQPESLVKLVGSGNTATVEEEWMRLAESADTTPARMLEYRAVLAELCRAGRTKTAEELAWAAIEAVSTNHSPAVALTVAGPFLLTIGDSEELRAQAMELYRTAYADREGLEALLDEAGLGGGRPVRRALRTLDVCLAIDIGDFLAARDEDGAARVETLERTSWVFGIDTERGAEELGAVPLADRYEPAPETDFRVMQHFAPSELAKRLQDDPASVVISVCRRNDNAIDSDRLEALLVPRHLQTGEWKKWWTRARTALKQCPNIRLDGRLPYTISYVDKPIALEDTAQKAFDRARDPVARLDVVEKYLRECKSYRQPPSEEALRRWYDSFRERAGRAVEQGNATAWLLWVIARRVGELGGIEGAARGAVELFKTADDVGAVLASIESDVLIDLACTCLVEARPDDWQDQLLALLPTFPLASCERAARRLLQAGRDRSDFEPVVQQILASPVAHFEALLWLWDGPSDSERITQAAPITILSRLLRTLEECRRSEQIPKEQAKVIASRARSVLSARRYERFHRCLERLAPGMAVALKTQIGRLGTLGRAVREDLLGHIRHHFPTLDIQPTVDPWARDDVLYVTRAGLARKQRQIEHHVNVTMKENARAIGAAAERGDLSENSEYKFALEERDLLQARLAQMNAETAIARVLNPDDVPVDHVGIGTKAVFERAGDGHRYEMTFLGPWEADAENGLFNYAAPLAQKIMGKRIGDTVELSHADIEGTYEVVALESGLAE